MNVEIGAEAAQFPEKEYINGIAVAVQEPGQLLLLFCFFCRSTLRFAYFKMKKLRVKMCVNPFIKECVRSGLAGWGTVRRVLKIVASETGQIGGNWRRWNILGACSRRKYIIRDV
jgi:hypothetical protein